MTERARWTAYGGAGPVHLMKFNFARTFRGRQNMLFGGSNYDRAGVTVTERARWSARARTEARARVHTMKFNFARSFRGRQNMLFGGRDGDRAGAVDRLGRRGPPST